jgi:hypothetical protein
MSLTATVVDSSKGPFTSPPYAAKYDNSPAIEVVVRGPNATLFRRKYSTATGAPDSGFMEFDSVTMNSAPVCVVLGTNQLHVFCLGGTAGNYVQHTMIVDTQLREVGATTPPPKVAPKDMGPPAIPPQPAMYPPTAVSGSNHIHLFAVGTDSFVYHIVYTGHTTNAGPKWGAWTRVGNSEETKVSTEVTAVSTPHRLDVFALSSEHHLLHTTSNATVAGSTTGARQWTSWNPLGLLRWYSKPTAAASSGDNIHVFSTDNTSIPYRKSWNGTVWTEKWNFNGSWTTVFGPLTAFRVQNTVGAQSLKNLCITSTRQIAEMTWNGSTWSDMVVLKTSGGVQAQPAAVGIGNGRYMLFYLGDDSNIVWVDVTNS